MSGFSRVLQMTNTRRDFIKGLIGIGGLALAGSLVKGCSAIEKKLDGQIPTYSTIAHDFLDIEEFGVTYSDYRTLDEIIYEAEKRIELKAKPPYSRRQALTVLEAIDYIMKEKGFGVKEGYLLNKGLKDKKLDCDSLSIIYLGIADVLKLPLKVARAPRHVFVRWHFDENDCLNWETTEGIERTDEKYRSMYKIDDTSVKNGVFLRSLNIKETSAIAYNVRGAILGKDFKKHEEAIENYDKAIKLNPLYPMLYCNKGIALWNLKKHNEALANFEKALELDPNYIKASYCKENILLQLRIKSLRY